MYSRVVDAEDRSRWDICPTSDVAFDRLAAGWCGHCNHILSAAPRKIMERGRGEVDATVQMYSSMRVSDSAIRSMPRCRVPASV